MRLISLGRTQISLQLVKSSLVVHMTIEKCKCSIVRDSVCLSVGLTGWLAGWLAVCLSACLSVCLSVYLSICLSVCLRIFPRSTFLSICLVWSLATQRKSSHLMKSETVRPVNCHNHHQNHQVRQHL